MKRCEERFDPRHRKEHIGDHPEIIQALVGDRGLRDILLRPLRAHLKDTWGCLSSQHLPP